MTFTHHGVVAVTGGELRISQINSAIFAMKKTMTKNGKFYCRVCPNYSVTKKPLKVKMGGGKGKFDHYSCFVRPGKVIFEVADVSLTRVREALRVCSSKLPMKTILVGFN